MDEPANPPKTQTMLHLDQELLQSLVIHKNVDQELIVTTIDKVKLHLISHQEALKAKRDWVAPLGIFSSLLITLITADFKNLVFSPEIWNALFIFGLIASFLWLIYAIYQVIKFRNQGEINEFINALRGDEKINEST